MALLASLIHAFLRMRRMGVVARPATQAGTCLISAPAGGQLLNVPGYAASRLPFVHKGCNHLLPQHTGFEILSGFPRQRNSNFPSQMALFAHAISRAVVQLGWVYDIALRRIGGMGLSIPVTACTTDRHWLRAPRRSMAEQTLGRDLTKEVGVLILLVSR